MYIDEAIINKEVPVSVAPLCKRINSVIRLISVSRGAVYESADQTETKHIYIDRTIKCTYIDSDLGDRYLLESMTDEGPDSVYGFRECDGRKTIEFMAPGDWSAILDMIIDVYGLIIYKEE